MLVRELAEALGLTFEGDGAAELTGANDVRLAGPSELSFASNAKVLAGAAAAGCLVLPPGLDAPQARAVLRAADPRAAFARAVSLLYPPPPPRRGMHPTAVVAGSAEVHPDASVGPHATVGERARIGANTNVGPGCRIGDDCSVGEGCTLHGGVTLYPRVRVGNRVVLHTGAVLGADGFGFAFTGGRYEKFPQIGTVEIGDDVEIGANSCVDRAALGVTSIGEGTKLDNMVHIGHNCRIGRHVVIAAQTGLSGGVIVEDYVVIGGQVGIGDKARIESGAVLGSGSGVLTSKVVRRGTYWGTPARPLRDYLRTLAEFNRLARTRSPRVAEKQ